MGDLPSEELALFPESIAAITAFQVVATQWRMRSVPVGMGSSVSRPCGLDYSACVAIFNARNITVPPDVWADIQTIEQAILEDVSSRR